MAYKNVVEMPTEPFAYSPTNEWEPELKLYVMHRPITFDCGKKDEIFPVDGYFTPVSEDLTIKNPTNSTQLYRITCNSEGKDALRVHLPFGIIAPSETKKVTIYYRNDGSHEATKYYIILEHKALSDYLKNHLDSLPTEEEKGKFMAMLRQKLFRSSGSPKGNYNFNKPDGMRRIVAFFHYTSKSREEIEKEESKKWMELTGKGAVQADEKQEETKQEETKQEETKQEETKQEESKQEANDEGNDDA